MKLNFEVMNLGNQIVVNLKLRYTHKVFKNFSRDRAVHDHCYLTQPLTECWIDNGLKVCNNRNNWYCQFPERLCMNFQKNICMSKVYQRRGAKPSWRSDPIYLQRLDMQRRNKILQYEHVSKVRDIYINRTAACVCSDKLQIQANIGHSELFKLVIFLLQISNLNSACELACYELKQLMFRGCCHRMTY